MSIQNFAVALEAAVRFNCLGFYDAQILQLEHSNNSTAFFMKKTKGFQNKAHIFKKMRNIYI